MLDLITPLVISTKIDIVEHYLRKDDMKRILKNIYFLPPPPRPFSLNTF